MKLKMRQNRIVLVSCLCLFLTISGCVSSTTQVREKDVLTLKKSDDERIKITVLVKYAFTINNFEKIVEEKFKDIDIVQVGNFTANAVLAQEYEKRLKQDDLTDIVMTWPMDVGEEYLKERLIDLSGMAFTSKYKTSMLDSIASKDGSLYYLPGPAQIRGIVYNKTLFNEKGWEVPNNYNEFIALCKEIEASGMRSYQLSLENEEVLDTAFMSFTYGNAFSKASDVEWIDAYNHGEGKFYEHFGSALETFQELIDAGIYKEEDLSLSYADVQRNLYTRKAAMIEDGVQLTKMHEIYAKDSKDEFAIMPFFNKNPESDWARIYMTCYIGLNKHLLDAGKEEKYKKVIALLEYISSEEGQIALSSDSVGQYSSLKNVGIGSGEVTSQLVSAFEEGRFGVFKSLERSSDTLRKGLAQMIKKQKNAQEVAAFVDEANEKARPKNKSKVLAKVKEDFSLQETGSFLASILKEEAKSDFGLFFDNGKDGKYNGKGVCAKIYKGSFKEEDLDRIFPDLMYDESGELWIVKIRGDNLIKALSDTMEISGSRDWFYYTSGLKVTFNPTQTATNRIKDVRLANGDKLQADKVYRVAVMDHCIDESLLVGYENTGKNIKQLFKDAIQEKGIITNAGLDEFLIINE